MLFYRTGEVADEVWDIFLYQPLVNTDSDMQKAVDVQKLMAAHRSGDYEAKLALHEAYYPATSAALLAHVDGFIEDIDRLIKKAETLLENCSGVNSVIESIARRN